MIVKDILNDKVGLSFVEANENESVFGVLRQMAELDVGAVIVRDNDGEVVGMFSERDYARKLVLEKKATHSTAVKDVMVPKVVYVTPDFTLEECLSVMIEKNIKNLPVIEDRSLVALLPMERIVKKLLSEKNYMIEELTKYITGTSLSVEDKNKNSVRIFEMSKGSKTECTYSESRSCNLESKKGNAPIL